MKDRQRVLEAALADAGVLERGTVDSYQPDDALKSELDAERKKLVNDIIDVLTASPSDIEKK